jgi:hypothetical protein
MMSSHFYSGRISEGRSVLASGNLLQLNAAALKLGKPQDKCPLCGKNYDKAKPPYGMVGRIDFVSSEHRKMITMLNDDGKKYVENGYFTFSRVKKYFGL